MKSIFNHSIILGSQSPRRAFLMKESGFDFEVKTIDVDESYPKSLSCDEVAQFIANKKARAYHTLLDKDQIGLVADTVVHLNGEILGKPQNKEEAKAMLRKMSGTMHDVYTGVGIFNNHKSTSFTGHSEVYFSELNDEEIDFYIDKFQPFDKAGSYGIQEWIGYTKIQKIVGSYSNIMGLPMELVYEELFKFVEK